MTVESFWPTDPLVRGFVEVYRLIKFNETVEGVTIANGRVDSVMLIEGRLERFDVESESYVLAPKHFFSPFSRSGTKRLRIRKGTKLINVKFYPHLLTRPIFDQYTHGQFLGFQSVFDVEANEKLDTDLMKSDHIEGLCGILDDFHLHNLLNSHHPDSAMISRMVENINRSDFEALQLSDFAKEEGISYKTLERRFRQHTGLSIKSYIDLHRFQSAARKINGGKVYEHGKLMEALGSGYYDQSHFVKACRKITGVSPKELFTNLPEVLTDFMLISEG